MTVRTRSRGSVESKGYYRSKYSGTDYNGPSWYTDWEFTEDVADNPGGNNPFLSIKRNGDPIRLDGETSLWEYHGLGIHHSEPNAYSAEKGTASATANLLSRTSPTRADFSLPVSLVELRDLPQLVQTVGESLLSKAASGYVTNQFGIRPLFSDVQKLVTFVGSVNNRLAELEKLRGSGLYRRRDIENITETVTHGTFPRWTVGLFLTTREQTKYMVHQWGTVRWIPGPSIKGPAGSYDSTAINLALGTDPNQITSAVWNSLPWTWLLDWFSNFGDFLAAGGGTIAYASKCSIMTHTKAERKMDVVDISLPVGATVTANPGSTTLTHESKMRVQGSVLPSLNINALSGRQTSILGSLAVLKGRGGRT